MRTRPVAALVAALLCLGTYAPTAAVADPSSVDDRGSRHERAAALLGPSESRLVEHEPELTSAPGPASSTLAHSPPRPISERSGGDAWSRSIPLLPIAARPGSPRAPPRLLH
jgi:hypothetical protein